MAEIGKLTLGILRNGDSVSAAKIRSTRPMAAQILKGKTPAQVLQIVPLLFSVCGKAQGAAASAALHAAQQAGSSVSVVVERMIVCEAMQEHLWRIMLDWPALLGMERQEHRFAGWYALIRKIGAGLLSMDVFLQEFEQECLCMPVEEWRKISNYHGLQTWLSKVHSPIAQLLAKVAELEQGKHVMTGSKLLPAWTAAQASQACNGRWNKDFSARPDWLGETVETGAWTYFAEDRLLQDVLLQSGSKALTRLLARILDVISMASVSSTPRLDVVNSGTGVGLSVVRTARGILMHHVCLVDELVQDYVIVAPTEWNFHPDGVFVQEMLGLRDISQQNMQQHAHITALSLDPCVAFEIEVRNA